MEDKKVKWLLVTNYVHERLIRDEECLRTGLYSWIPVFDGDVVHWRDVTPEKLKKYDVIQVNLSGQDVHLVGEIRAILGKDSKTKIVANNDYTLELWSHSFDYLPTMAREINHADMVFGTEPYQVGALEILLKRKVHLIVHPCFVKRLKSLAKPRQQDVISMVSHRYDNYQIQPSIAIKGLGPRTRLIGYDETSDRKKFVTSVCFNEVMLGTNYTDFCKQLAESKVVVDPFTFTSQSRTGWDCAAMGVPMVGSDRNYSARVCFPYTTCSPYDIKEIRRLTKKLLEDEEFRKKVIDYAQEKVEYVSYENSKKKYLAALDEGSPEIET